MTDGEKLKQALLALAEVVDAINWRRAQLTQTKYHDVLSEVRRLLE